MKKTITDISRRFSTRILLKKQKSGKEQETVKGKQKEKDLEMLTPVTQAVTDRLYNNDDKISKGGTVKKSSAKATGGRGRPRQTSSVNSTVV